ncbi:MAG: hypothetical protein JO217_00465, partial [Acidobacteriaceae bacterium]|nr:hypothetical protein [Acidobacteriaceae bacterium]
MTQALNASHARLSGNKKSLATEASAGKQAGRQNTRIGHVGLHAINPVASAEFYKDVFGMEITGGSASEHPLGATAFLTSRPGEEPHENRLGRQPRIRSHRFQGLFTCRVPILPRARCGEEDPDQVVFNHHESFAFYFDDPGGNMIEVYWPTGDLSWRQPYAEPLDL